MEMNKTELAAVDLVCQTGLDKIAKRNYIKALRCVYFY